MLSCHAPRTVFETGCHTWQTYIIIHTQCHEYYACTHKAYNKTGHALSYANPI